MPAEILSELREMWHANKQHQPKAWPANNSNLDVSIFTMTGEFYLFFFPAEKSWTAHLPARPPVRLLKHSFEMASLTSFTRYRPLTCPNTASEKLQGSSRAKTQGWKKVGGLLADLVQTERVWLNLMAREGPSSGCLTSG